METATYTDRVKLPFSYDVEQLKKEVNQLAQGAYEYYKVIPLRAPAHQVNPSLPCLRQQKIMQTVRGQTG